MKTHYVAYQEQFAEFAQTNILFEDALDDICEWLNYEFDYYFVSIHHTRPQFPDRLFYWSGSPYHIFEQVQAYDHGTSVASQINMVCAAYNEQHVFIVNDCANSLNWLPNPLIPMSRSQMTIPLLAEQDCVGVLSIYSDRTHAFSQDGMDWIPALSRALGELIAEYT